MNPSWFAALFFVSIFVCAFMAGLGLGSWAAGGRALTDDRPINEYLFLHRAFSPL